MLGEFPSVEIQASTPTSHPRVRTPREGVPGPGTEREARRYLRGLFRRCLPEAGVLFCPVSESSEYQVGPGKKEDGGGAEAPGGGLYPLRHQQVTRCFCTAWPSTSDLLTFLLDAGLFGLHTSACKEENDRML